ncbi:MAG: hypothetical protein IJN55_05515 [Alistipes sp.]|nr:hypothetical protein [Alistipes sp.]
MEAPARKFRAGVFFFGGVSEGGMTFFVQRAPPDRVSGAFLSFFHENFADIKIITTFASPKTMVP